MAFNYYHYCPDPFMLAAARKEFEELFKLKMQFLHDGHRWVKMAVYDCLGGRSARTQMWRDEGREKYITQQWFSYRFSSDLSAIDIVKAEILELEQEETL